MSSFLHYFIYIILISSHILRTQSSPKSDIWGFKISEGGTIRPPLIFLQIPVPQPGERHVLLKVEACGICHGAGVTRP